MKKLLVILFLVLIPSLVFAQDIGVGVNVNEPDIFCVIRDYPWAYELHFSFNGSTEIYREFEPAYVISYRDFTVSPQLLYYVYDSELIHWCVGVGIAYRQYQIRYEWRWSEIYEGSALSYYLIGGLDYRIGNSYVSPRLYFQFDNWKADWYPSWGYNDYGLKFAVCLSYYF